MDLAKKIKAAQRVSVPLVAIATPDPASTIDMACAAINGTSPKIVWDIVRGLSPRNEAGRDAMVAAGLQPGESDLVSTLNAAAGLPEKTVLFLMNAHRFMENPMFVQAVWNLRDTFKLDHRMLVMLGPAFTMPAELHHDVLVLDEPLPTAEQLGAIVTKTIQDAGLSTNEAEVGRSVEAVLGMPAFPTEQVVAMSLTHDGVQHDDLWERKRKQIEGCTALRVHRKGERFEDIGGCDAVKEFFRGWISGPDRPNCIVFLDELEKSLGGSDTDTSGVSQDQLATLLTEMQDNEYDGCIFIGVAGAAKSAIAKAVANEAGVPNIQLDLGGAKGSLVGASEQAIRDAMKVIKAVSNGKALFVATCNSIGNLKPELQRRFTLPTFFFDLPSGEERDRIWALYITKFELASTEALNKPADEGWTGAEIKQCCRLAKSLGKSIKDAAKYITPMCRKSPELIERLRSQCDGKYLSASYEGTYRKDAKEAKPAAARRKLELE